MNAPLWTIPDSDHVSIIDDARRLANRLADGSGEDGSEEETRPHVIAIAFDGILNADELADSRADEIVTVEAESDGQAFRTGAAGVRPRAAALQSLATEESPQAVLLPSTPDGDELAAVTSRRLRGGCVTDCLLRVRNNEIVAGRAVYGDRAYAEFSFERGPPVVSLNSEALESPEESPSETPTRRTFQVAAEDDGSIRHLGVVDIPEQDLSRAQRIVAGGYGLGDPDGFELVSDLADALGAAVGASRPPADEEWVPYDRQIGVTGKEIDVELYIPCAISGDSYHMRTVTAEHLIPINDDPEARIFNFADIGIVGDVYEYGPALVEAIEAAATEEESDSEAEGAEEVAQ